MNETKLRVCHYPQVPCKPFITEISTVDEGKKIIDILADYDLFQFDNKIKPDYASATTLEVWEENCDGKGNPGWSDWQDEEGDTIDAYILVCGKAIKEE